MKKNKTEQTYPENGKYALVIIDMQNDFVLKNAPFRINGALKCLPKTVQALKFFRSKKRPVFHIIRQYREDGSDIEITRMKNFLTGKKVVVPGTKGAQIVKELKPKSNEYIVVKHRFSAFMETELNFILTRLRIDNLVICGIDLANCIRTTVYDGVSYDYNVILLTDASASSTERVAKDNIRDIANIGVKCMTVEKFTSI